ncbi:PH domain-containing protein [Terrihabitans rhizophilus]|uniref:PH domain-containing protein n=1 Tax=Terrihabitans rhizophilus TaxID=3092662 RepID=A0ABU4RN98_9HYPH|nr:PH domain-containing protein [Terrihabitans sp. PJ23]MDX6805584.1 PH domain-containing protein [Terrihabitans sp. PJ23]
MGILDGLMGHGSDVSAAEVQDELKDVLLPGEPVQVAFRVVRDLYVFTDRRMILVDKQGMTGRKVEYFVVPYRAITAYSIENAGRFDLESELKIWVSGMGAPIQKTLRKGADVRGIQAAIAGSL